MFKRILVPVDGSATATKALQAALELARGSGGRVRIVHALDELPYVSGFDYSAELVRVARDYAGQVLREAAAVAQDSGVPSDVKLLEGTAQRLGDAIAEEAAGWEADLVVVGTHGRRGVTRLLLGSGAEQVLRSVPLPVLTIRGNASTS